MARRHGTRIANPPEPVNRTLTLADYGRWNKAFEGWLDRRPDWLD
jgi:hypothetical protein